MEYVHGKDLKSIMIRCKMREIELPIQMAVYMMVQVLRGLDYAHEKRDNFDQRLDIVHRDVSPHNVLISLWGQVRILDFGIAKASHIASSTQTGILKGKFSYMSPEQALGKQVDLRTDIYSAGIVLWELLTLDNYFQGQTDIRLLEHVREAQIRDPRDINPKIPKSLAQIVMKALARKSKKRYQTAEDFARALEKYQHEKFGRVTEKDLAAYIRNLFGVSTAEISSLDPPKSPRDLIAGKDEGSFAETMATGAGSSSSSRPARRGKEWSVPSALWKAPLLIAISGGLGALFYFHSPQAIWQKADREVITLAKHVQGFLPRTSHEEPVLIDLGPEINNDPLYVLNYAPQVRQTLGGLSFEHFDQVQEIAVDLSYNPRPAAAALVARGAGSYVLREAGFQYVYQVNEELRTVTLTRLKRLKR